MDLSRRVRYSPPAKVLIRQLLSGEALSEEMRVLYVALTRAREKLVVTGAVRNLEKARAKWAFCVKKDGAVLPGQILAAHNYLDWIMFGISGSESGLFDVSFYQKADLQKAPAPDSEAEETAFLPPTAEIDRRLGYSYRHKNLFAVPAKVTVTELKRRFAEPEEGGLQLEIKQPNFIKSEKDFTSLQKGSYNALYNGKCRF